MTDLLNKPRIRGIILAIPTWLSLLGVPDFGPMTIYSIHETNPTITVRVETDYLAQMRLMEEMRRQFSFHPDAFTPIGLE